MAQISKMPRASLTKPFAGSADTETMFFQFNPDTLKRRIRVEYSRLLPRRGTFEHMNYDGTKNQVIPLKLFFTNIDRPKDQGWPSLKTRASGPSAGSLSEPERFLESCCYPDVKRRQLVPPTLIFNWPRMVRMYVRILELEFSWEHFSQRDLSGTVLVANMSLLEFPDETGIHADKVRERGALRIPATYFQFATGLTINATEGRQTVSTQQTRGVSR